MKTLLKNKSAVITHKEVQDASKQTLEQLCMSQDSLTDDNNKKLALTFLLIDGYISNHAEVSEI